MVRTPRSLGEYVALVGDGRGDGAVEGATTTKAVFEAYVEQVLAPRHCDTRAGGDPGQPHRPQEQARARARRGEGLPSAVLASLLVAGPLAHCEEAFSKVKALLKKDAPRTRKALVEGIGRALSVISARDAAGWFAHCGYWPGAQTS